MTNKPSVIHPKPQGGCEITACKYCPYSRECTCENTTGKNGRNRGQHKLGTIMFLILLSNVKNGVV